MFNKKLSKLIASALVVESLMFMPKLSAGLFDYELESEKQQDSGYPIYLPFEKNTEWEIIEQEDEQTVVLLRNYKGYAGLISHLSMSNPNLENIKIACLVDQPSFELLESFNQKNFPKLKNVYIKILSPCSSTLLVLLKLTINELNNSRSEGSDATLITSNIPNNFNIPGGVVRKLSF